ncbi:MAG: Hsp20/alpha crystallin family protein [Planctomycetes bacterium]|nr:Hsp20/alpha crystallin family protein [Planctomycetota bacterium]
MDRLVSQFGRTRAAAFPPVNVYNEADGAVVTMELPGVDPADLDVSVSGHALAIRGQRKGDPAGEGDTWHRRERTFGSFARSIELPFEPDPDGVEATCRDGVLEIRVRRHEAEQPRRITVKG